MLFVEPAVKEGLKGGVPEGQGPPATPEETSKPAAVGSGEAGLAQGVNSAVAR